MLTVRSIRPGFCRFCPGSPAGPAVVAGADDANHRPIRKGPQRLPSWHPPSSWLLTATTVGLLCDLFFRLFYICFYCYWLVCPRTTQQHAGVQFLPPAARRRSRRALLWWWWSAAVGTTMMTAAVVIVCCDGYCFFTHIAATKNTHSELLLPLPPRHDTTDGSHFWLHATPRTNTTSVYVCLWLVDWIFFSFGRWWLDRSKPEVISQTVPFPIDPWRFVEKALPCTHTHSQIHWA